MSEDHTPRQEPTGPDEHIWRQQAPRPRGQRTPGAALIGLAFLVVVGVVVVGLVLLIVSGALSVEPAPPLPQR